MSIDLDLDSKIALLMSLAAEDRAGCEVLRKTGLSPR